MVMSKKLLLLLSLAALIPAVVAASEEEDRKEAAVNPVVVHMPAEQGSEWEAREDAVSQRERTKTLEALRLARELENKRKVEEHVETLPVDPKSKILSYLELPYKQWQIWTNVKADRIFFKGVDLVSITGPRDGNLGVAIINPSDRTVIKSFTIPVATPPRNDSSDFSDLNNQSHSSRCAWSYDGSTIAVMNPDERHFELWSTDTGTLKISIPADVFGLQQFDNECRIFGLSHDGTKLFVRVNAREEALLPREDEADVYKIIVIDTKIGTQVTLTDSELFTSGLYTFNADTFLARVKDTTQYAWSVATGAIRSQLNFFTSGTQFYEVILSNDGTKIAIRVNRTLLLVGNYTAASNSITQLKRLNTKNGLFLSFNHNNSMCAVALLGKNATGLYSTATGTLEQTLKYPKNDKSSANITFSSDDSMFASRTLGGAIILWKKSTALQDALLKSEELKQKEKKSRSSSSMPRSEEEQITPEADIPSEPVMVRIPLP